jgi:hypothetical protein
LGGVSDFLFPVFSHGGGKSPLPSDEANRYPKRNQLLVTTHAHSRMESSTFRSTISMNALLASWPPKVQFLGCDNLIWHSAVTF